LDLFPFQVVVGRKEQRSVGLRVIKRRAIIEGVCSYHYPPAGARGRAPSDLENKGLLLHL